QQRGRAQPVMHCRAAPRAISQASQEVERDLPLAIKSQRGVPAIAGAGTRARLTRGEERAIALGSLDQPGPVYRSLGLPQMAEDLGRGPLAASRASRPGIRSDLACEAEQRRQPAVEARSDLRGLQCARDQVVESF